MHPADIDLLAMLKRVRLPTVANVLPRFIERAAAEGWDGRGAGLIWWGAVAGPKAPPQLPTPKDC